MRLISPAIAVGRDDLRESFGFAVSITRECFEAFTRRPEGSSSSDGRGEHTGKICAKILIAIFGRFARDIGAMGIGNERRILSTGNGWRSLGSPHEH
jgi:hypothetical protein